MTIDVQPHTPPVITQRLEAADGVAFDVHFWPQESAKATVQLLHGKTEHWRRYQPLIHHLYQQGYQIVAHNHRGHGEREPLGHFADKEGWSKVIQDIRLVQQTLHKSEPWVLFGHSMGSFLATEYAIRYGDDLQALILSGGNYQSPTFYYAAKLLSHCVGLIKGYDHPSSFLSWVSNSKFNRYFDKNTKSYQWISRDHKQVEAYVADPRCAFDCSPQFWIDILQGLIGISKPERLAQIPSSLPVYLFAGDHDPVGQMGKGVPALQDVLQAGGVKSVTCQLYPEGRHEMLNEINASQVMDDLSEWLATTL
ncbi:alpha/beta fold hydrolase [Pleionea sp. CnH1-48]|uniref:alpha/beta fold hydrolase n=1 Tax=Pleionea sp. CnH1-48 TaxID=2954494 RepID=UPI002097D2AC|nr:alpha/beta hydrolase [Pleionea sp. CnH1-48]MCO7224233.1 alpha/beta hydrolase [Pleionea sp. CnH1-48]